VHQLHLLEKLRKILQLQWIFVYTHIPLTFWYHIIVQWMYVYVCACAHVCVCVCVYKEMSARLIGQIQRAEIYQQLHEYVMGFSSMWVEVSTYWSADITAYMQNICYPHTLILL
jgi:hypothetical protein